MPHDIRMLTPVHPGPFLREEVIAPLGLTVSKGAEILGVTRAALSSVLNGRAGLSPEMALRVEKAFGLSMETLLRMQTNYDIARTRLRSDQIKVTRFDPAVGGKRL